MSAGHPIMLMINLLHQFVRYFPYMHRLTPSKYFGELLLLEKMKIGQDNKLYLLAFSMFLNFVDHICWSIKPISKKSPKKMNSCCATGATMALSKRLSKKRKWSV